MTISQSWQLEWMNERAIQCGDEYFAEHRPPFQNVTGIQQSEREAFANLILAKTGSTAMPASVVLNSRDEVVYCELGVPTISELGKSFDHAN